MEQETVQEMDGMERFRLHVKVDSLAVYSKCTVLYSPVPVEVSICTAF